MSNDVPTTPGEPVPLAGPATPTWSTVPSVAAPPPAGPTPAAVFPPPAASPATFPSSFPAPTMAGFAPPAPRRPSRSLIVILALGVALLATGGFLAFYLVQLNQANAVIEQRDDTIDKQDRTIEEQEDLIDKKETFGDVMAGVLGTASEFEGTVVGDIVPTDGITWVADKAWSHRWDADQLDDDIAEAQEMADDLDALLVEAESQTASNSTGSAYETTIDLLGGGLVSSVIDDADTFCSRDVIACVSSVDPRVVHFDAADHALPYMTDWLRTGIAYHEFAHVLQFTHPEESAVALEFFSGDEETMADCFALTYLDGWTLDHTVWVSSREYWEVSLGYGYTCDETQRQAVRDWYGSLAYTVEPVTQGG